MRINRFFGNFDFNSKEIKISDREICRQIKDVLRLKAGEKIILFNDSGKEASVEIKKIEKGLIKTEIIKIKENVCEPENEIILYCSILKGEHFEMVAEKATEVGVKKIVPIICERTVKTGIRKERLEKIIKEAAEQSGRAILPLLDKEIDFKEAVAEARENNLNLFFDLSGEKFSFNDAIKMKVGVFIGPEGGWSKEELKIAKENNFKIFSLSKNTFRAETAAIIGSYLVNL